MLIKTLIKALQVLNNFRCFRYPISARDVLLWYIYILDVANVNLA
jgi:hypothetical protein